MPVAVPHAADAAGRRRRGDGAERAARADPVSRSRRATIRFPSWSARARRWSPCATRSCAPPPRRSRWSSKARAAAARSWSRARSMRRSARRDRRFCPINCAALVDELVEVGAVRTCARRLHRRDDRSTGRVRGGQRRHAVPRRNRRARRPRSGQAAAHAAGRRNPPAWRNLRPQSRRPHRRRHQSAAGAAGRRRARFAPTSGIASTSSASRCRRCASASTMCRCSSNICGGRWQARTGSRARLSATALGALAAYDWPGNVRELQNVLASMLVADAARRTGRTVGAAGARGARRGARAALDAGRRAAPVRGAIRARGPGARRRPHVDGGARSRLEPTGAGEAAGTAWHQ